MGPIDKAYPAAKELTISGARLRTHCFFASFPVGCIHDAAPSLEAYLSNRNGPKRSQRQTIHRE